MATGCFLQSPSFKSSCSTFPSTLFQPGTSPLPGVYDILMINLPCNVSGKSLSRIYCTPLTLSPVRTPGTFAATKTIYYSRTPSPSVIALTKTRILSHNTVFSSPQLSVFSAERKNSNVAREKKKIKTQSDVKSQHEVQKRTDWVENVSVRPVKLELRWVVNGHNKSYEQMCHHIII